MDGGWDLPRLALILGAGLAAGFINVNAGGGSLLTLPALLLLGMPATAANATNRVGIVLQNAVASDAFRRRGRLRWRLGLKLLVPSIPGVLVGSRLALELDEVWFRRILAAVLLMVLVSILRGGRHRGADEASETPPHPVALHLAYFALGVYSGFIQAGVGFLLIAALTRLGGLDLVRTNAVKVFTVFFLQIVALVVFQQAGQVLWLPGLVLGLGTMAGGWVGSQVQMDRGEVWVRRFLVVTLIAFAAKLLADSFRLG
jgi:uncharacterized membrane protein YfcA